MHTTDRRRFMAGTGALFVLLICVGNSMSTAGTTQSVHPTGRQVLRDLRQQVGEVVPTVGFLLEVLGFVAFLGFLGYLAATLLARGRGPRPPVAAGTAVAAGLTMLAIKLGSAAPMLVLQIDRHDLSPRLARLLADLNGAAFVVSWLPMAVFVGATAVALRRDGLVGSPTAWAGAVVGVAGVPLALAGFLDPVGANPLAFLLALLWVLVVSARLALGRVPASTAEVPGVTTAVRRPDHEPATVDTGTVAARS